MNMKIMVMLLFAASISPVALLAADEPDPYLWLEDIEGPEALAWVEERNRESLSVLENLPPDYQRCLISLSRGGADATVVREFDIPSKTFVADGFNIAEAKSDMYYWDRDTVFVGTDFGSGSMIDSGYPRITKKWQRGQPLTEAEVI